MCSFSMNRRFSSDNDELLLKELGGTIVIIIDSIQDDLMLRDKDTKEFLSIDIMPS